MFTFFECLADFSKRHAHGWLPKLVRAPLLVERILFFGSVAGTTQRCQPPPAEAGQRPWQTPGRAPGAGPNPSVPQEFKIDPGTHVTKYYGRGEVEKYPWVRS